MPVSKFGFVVGDIAADHEARRLVHARQFTRDAGLLGTNDLLMMRKVVQ
jgi:hypothetical protein